MRILHPFFSKHFKYRIIAPDCPERTTGRPLMTRYALLRRKAFAIFLHHFHRSDLGEFHDHPWNFITFLFHRGYWEVIPLCQFVLPLWAAWSYAGDDEHGRPIAVRVWRPRFSILYRPATYQHYIELESCICHGRPNPTWTLVLRFKERRQWGFILKGRWVQWNKMDKEGYRSICE
jgi:hypothetical protein